MPIKYDLSFNPEHFELQPPPDVLEAILAAQRRQLSDAELMEDHVEQWARFRRAIRRDGPHLYEMDLKKMKLKTMGELGRLGYV